MIKNYRYNRVQEVGPKDKPMHFTETRQTKGQGEIRKGNKTKNNMEQFKSEMKKIRIPLQKVVGHKRRERHEKAKNIALAKKK